MDRVSRRATRISTGERDFPLRSLISPPARLSSPPLGPEVETTESIHSQSKGEFPCVMKVMFKHVPDHPLARTSGDHPFSFDTQDILQIRRTPTRQAPLNHLPGQI